MTRKLSRMLAYLGIGGITLFQANGCDAFLESFWQGFQIGYESAQSFL